MKNDNPYRDENMATVDTEIDRNDPVEELRELIKTLKQVDFENLPQFQFVLALKNALLNQGFSENEAEELIFECDIQISQFNPNNPKIQEVILGFAEVCGGIKRLLGKRLNNPMLMLKQMAVRFRF